MNPLRIGSRGSQLALFQANLAAQRIAEAGGPPSEIIVIKTSGDRVTDKPLSEIGGKRLFVKEIEDALLSGDIDLAVHSSKDMPAELPDGLVVASVLPREDPRDAMVGSLKASLIGTGSVRRVAQLRRLYPSAAFKDIRGNLDTRLRKLDEGQFDAIVLAAAGLRRLGFASRISHLLSVDDCIPAPGQGIIALETRADDRRAREAALRVNDGDAFAALEAERALVTSLGGGCQMPIGGLAAVSGTVLELRAVVASLDGSRVVRDKKVGVTNDAAALGRAVAEQLLRAGAADILRDAAAVPDAAPRQLT